MALFDFPEFKITAGVNIVFESRQVHAGLVFSKFGLFRLILTYMYSIYIYLSKIMLLSFSIPTKNCFKAQMTKNWSIFTIYIPLHWKVSLKLLTLENLIWEKKRKGDLLPMTWTRVLLWKPLKKGLEKSLVFWHGIGKILLNKVYNCVLCEKSNKLFGYFKINR